uniref:Nucleotide pyrophosphohydrolase n=1 Tax=Nocardiopsis flavescens TaxID=758803 RepID=A0A6M5K860_9ACTN|nr:nucleotide pyrophosphohydrolase [Nocardiopsis flavescens]
MPAVEESGALDRFGRRGRGVWSDGGTWYLSFMTVSSLQTVLADFAAEREWGRFHTPKNLVMALSGEVGELAAEFQWLTPQEASAVMEDPERARAVRSEMADVFSYLLRLADVLDVDLEEAVREKVALNADRYPADQVRGRAVKYTALEGRS